MSVYDCDCLCVYVVMLCAELCTKCPRQMWEARKDVMYEKIAADTMMEKESWRCRIWLDLAESGTRPCVMSSRRPLVNQMGGEWANPSEVRIAQVVCSL